jgi:hypothetical protein
MRLSSGIVSRLAINPANLLLFDQDYDIIYIIDT